jgi:outer membrane scaffolding protein for murein synthesis (MipA/OmpV family)
MNTAHGSCRALALVATLALALVALPSFAQEKERPEGEERAWDLGLGAGCYFEPKYPGGEGLYFNFLPVVKGELRLGIARLFVDTIRGAGVGARLGDSTPLDLSMGVNLGEGRKSSGSPALDGLPDLENPFRLFGEAELELPPLATLGLELRYLPSSAECRDGRRSYDAILAAARAFHRFRFGRGLWLDAGAGFDWMNADYAEANYGIADAAAGEEPYRANAGIRAVSCSLKAICMFSPSVGICLYCSADRLVGDAAGSPLVERAFQPSVGSFAFVRL